MRVDITCSDSDSGCRMQTSDAAGFSIVGSTYRRTFSTNTPSTGGSVTLRDNAGTGNTRSISYGTIRIDKTIPGTPPVITANDRSDDTWRNDNTTTLSDSPNTSGQISSRFNVYCLDSTAPYNCVPSSSDTTKPSTSGLADGIHHFRVRTCTQALVCSS